MRVLVDGASNGPQDEREYHPERRDQEQGTTTKSIDSQGGRNGNNKIEDRLACRKSKLLILLSDAGTLIDGVHVVGEESVTRVLRDDTKRNDDSQSPAITPCAEEVQIASRSVGFLLDTNCFLDLSKLELNSSVVNIPASMMLGKDLKRFFVSILVDKKTGRLRKPPNECKLDQRGNDLDKGDASPGPITVNVCSAPTDARDDWNMLEEMIWRTMVSLSLT